MATNTIATKPSQLLSLPLELRFIIYDLLISELEVHFCETSTSAPSSIFQTCRQLYIEIIPQLHSFLAREAATLSEEIRLDEEKVEASNIHDPATRFTRTQAMGLERLFYRKHSNKNQLRYVHGYIAISHKRMRRATEILGRL